MKCGDHQYRVGAQRESGRLRRVRGRRIPRGRGVRRHGRHQRWAGGQCHCRDPVRKELRDSLRDDMDIPQLRQAMLSAIACANDAIRQEAARNAEYQHMGTTLVCAVTRSDMAVIGNIGDSRAYHITPEGIFQISRDHSVVENMVAKGDLTPLEARTHPNRNLITRALGPDIHAKADAFELPWHKDEFLLLCSDGLVNTVSDQEMLFEVLHDGDVNECLDHLLQISLQRGAPDNITAVLLLNGEGR